MIDWILDNKEWIFSGVGISVLTGLYIFFKREKKETSVNNFININNTNSDETDKSSPVIEENKMDLNYYKNNTKILFVDDDARFKVVKILNKAGWVHTKLIKDCTLDDIDVVEADILFIDVQGVGLMMGFADEGLGLAEAIKNKYKDKKVVIYSAETNGDRFHSALRKADEFLAKNADPYEFQKLVEDFTVGDES